MEITAKVPIKINELIQGIEQTHREVNFHNITFLHVIHALSVHPQIGENGLIEKEYEKNKKDYFNCYRNSKFYKHHVLMRMPALISIRAQKLVAMYEYAEKDNKGREFISKYIVMGYKKIYDYVQHNRILYIQQAVSLLADTINHAYITSALSILVYLGNPSKEMWSDPQLVTLFTNMLNFIKNEYDPEFEQIRNNNERESLEKFKEIVGYKFGKEEILETILIKHSQALVKTLTPRERRQLEQKADFDPIHHKGLNRYWGAIAVNMQILGVNQTDYSNIAVSRDDLLNIYSIFKLNKEKGTLKEEEYEMFFTTCLIYLMYWRHYRKLQEYVQETFEKESGLELLQYEDVFKKEKVHYLENEKNIRKKIAQQEEFIHRLKKELEETSRQKREILQEQEELERLKKEVIGLREHVFSKEQEESFQEEEKSDMKNIEFLQNKKIAVIGGHPKWHQKLKQCLPHIRTITPDEINIDLSFLNQMDVVGFETSYNNHSQYHRVMSTIDKKDLIFLYINEKNIKKTVEKMAKSLM